MFQKNMYISFIKQASTHVPGLINKLRKYINPVECMHNHQWCPYTLERTHCALCCVCVMYQEQDKGEVSGCSCSHLAVLPIALFKCLYRLKRRREGEREGEGRRERGRGEEGGRERGRREGGRGGGGKEGEREERRRRERGRGKDGIKGLNEGGMWVKRVYANKVQKMLWCQV